jgi:hypothetical protein
MGRPRHPERHDWHQTLAARQNAPVKRGKLGQLINNLFHRSGDVSDKRGGFHRRTLDWVQ